MKARLSVVLCFVATLCSLTPTFAARAASSLPATGAIRSTVDADLLTADGENLALPAQVTTLSTAEGTLQGIGVRSGKDNAFAVVCRSWTTNGDIETTEGGWYLGANSGQPEPVSNLPISDPGLRAKMAKPTTNLAGLTGGPLAGLARKMPIVGHTCAVVRDASPANITILALDIAVVVLYAIVVFDVIVAITEVALTLAALTNPATSVAAVAAIYLLREQAAGRIAKIQKDLARAKAFESKAETLQAYIAQHADMEVLPSSDWVLEVLPAIIEASRPVVAAVQTAGQVAGQGAQVAGQAASKTGQTLAQGAGQAVSQGAQAAGQAASKAGQTLAKGAGQGSRALGPGAEAAGQAAAGAGRTIVQGAQQAAQTASSGANSAKEKATQLLRQACVKLPSFVKAGCLEDGMLRVLGQARNKEPVHVTVDGWPLTSTPDYMDKASRVLGEIEDVSVLAVSEQLRADVFYARQEGYTFRLHVRPNTQVPTVLTDLAMSHAGVEVMRDVPEP